MASMRRLGDTALGMLQTRLELLATEADEQKTRLVALLLHGILAMFFVGFGAVFVALFFTVLLWDTHRELVLGLSAGLFVVAAAFFGWRTRQYAIRGGKPFQGTLMELAEDRRQLTQGLRQGGANESAPG